MYSRREFVAFAAATCSGALPVAGHIDSRIAGVRLGVQTYSFRDLSLNVAVRAMKQIGIGLCELFMGHVEPSGLTRDQLRSWRLQTPVTYFERIRRRFSDAGIDLYAYSLNFNDSFTDAELARGFEMTKALGTDIITTSTTLSCARRLAPLAEKYNVRIALHGHDETSKPNEFAGPESFARGLAVSRQFYINLDIGHFSAAGFDPVSFINQNRSKILALHIKDRKANHGDAVPFGQGATPIKEVLLLMKKRKYPFPADIEYEYNDYQPGLNTISEVRKCFDYCKAVLS